MFGQMKYIVVDGNLSDTIYLFPGHVQHADFAQTVGATKDILLSAGFVSHSKDGLNCYGRSVSLDLASRSEDTKLLMREFGLDDI